MSYFAQTNSNGSFSEQNYQGLLPATSGKQPMVEFYEQEPGVVLDVIVDENHPIIQKNKQNFTVKSQNWPPNYKDESPSSNDIDYTWVGRALVRMVYSQKNIPQEELKWAKPLNVSGVVEFPLVGEIVIVVKYMNELYYTTKLNTKGIVNNSIDFSYDAAYGLNKNGSIQSSDSDNIQITKKLSGPESIFGNPNGTALSKGVVGKNFLANNRIRSLRKKEGDTSFESRFGQSIRFTSYSDDDSINSGDGKNKAYEVPSYNSQKNPTYGPGNPTTIIRNRQRQLAGDKDILIHPRLPKIPKIKDYEKNVGGLISEDINHDGSSIVMTSGKYDIGWRTTIYKSIFSANSEQPNIVSGSEEQVAFSPNGSTSYVIPKFLGDQIFIQSDRLIFSSRFGEIFNFGKKRISSATDGEYTIDAHGQIVMTTNVKTVINSPAIYLGQYDATGEPALLGQTTINWLYNLCNWMLNHTHWYKHSHPDAGEAIPDKTQKPVEVLELESLRDSLQTLMSRRVFITGGGFAPGVNGVNPAGTDSSIKATDINIVTGMGVPGGFNGKNFR